MMAIISRVKRALADHHDHPRFSKTVPPFVVIRRDNSTRHPFLRPGTIVEATHFGGKYRLPLHVLDQAIVVSSVAASIPFHWPLGPFFQDAVPCPWAPRCPSGHLPRKWRSPRDGRAVSCAGVAVPGLSIHIPCVRTRQSRRDSGRASPGHTELCLKPLYHHRVERGRDVTMVAVRRRRGSTSSVSESQVLHFHRCPISSTLDELMTRYKVSATAYKTFLEGIVRTV